MTRATTLQLVHHELGHNYYQLAYRHQPMLFRNGANDGFHEAIGDSIALSITPQYLKQVGLADKIPPVSADIPLLLRTAMDKVAFLPFGLLIDKWRWQVFSGEVKPADYNKAWWALRESIKASRLLWTELKTISIPAQSITFLRTHPISGTFWPAFISFSSIKPCATPQATRGR